MTLAERATARFPSSPRLAALACQVVLAEDHRRRVAADLVVAATAHTAASSADAAVRLAALRLTVR